MILYEMELSDVLILNGNWWCNIDEIHNNNNQNDEIVISILLWCIQSNNNIKLSNYWLIDELIIFV